jgi:hypothetical protein
MKKLFFLLVLGLIINSSSCFGTKENVSYSGIFDEGIYDQSDLHSILPPSGPPPHDTDTLSPASSVSQMQGEGNTSTSTTSSSILPLLEEPEVKLLQKKKKEQLTEKYIKTLMTLLESYKKTLALDDTWFGKIVDDLRSRPLAALVDSFCLLSHWWEGGTQQEAKAESQEKTSGKKHAERGRIADNPHIEMELVKIQAQIQERERNLEFEPILVLEKQYVIAKKNIPPRLQKQIERSLLLYRECTGHFLEVERRFINCALSLPRSPKEIIKLDNKAVDLKGIVDRIRTEFETFSPDIIRELVDAAVEIAINSICNESSYEGKLRTIRYFWGKPGGGKTSSVLKLAHILGLPCEQVRISSPQDLSSERLAGRDRFGDSRNIGWFLTPLLNPTEDGKTYSNAILLIDDIDLEISPDEVLSVLKLYLDPLTQVFDSPYFDCAINVARMNIFVTSNSPLPKTEKYAALRSRVPEIEFSSQKITEESSVLRSYVKEEAHKMGVSPGEENITSIINAANAILKERGQKPDFRNMRRMIEDLLREVLIGSIDTSTSIEAVIARCLAREALQKQKKGTLKDYFKPSSNHTS